MELILPSSYRNPLAYPAGVAPGFDPTHVAAQKVRLSAITAMGGGYIDLMTGKIAVKTSTPTFSIDGRIGPTNIVSSTTGKWVFSGMRTAAETDYTCAAIVYLNTQSAVGTMFQASGNATGPDFLFVTGVLTIGYRGNSSETSTITVPVGVPYFVASSRRGAGSSAAHVAVNLLTGQRFTSTSTAAVVTPGVTDGNYTLCNLDTNGNGLSGAMSHFVFTGKAISLPQLLQWAADPWSFWYPQRKFNWVGIAAGIQFDAASNSGYQTAQSTYSWSHTCSGANRYLTVGISMLSVAGSSVSSITYNGVNLSLISAKASVSGAVRAELWGLVAPATGSNTIAVTLSTGLDSVGGATSFTGVNQSSSIEGANNASATNVGAADATVNVTTVSNNDWCVDVVATSDTAITVGAGQTSRNNVSGTLGSGAMATLGATNPPATVAMSWTNVAALATWSIVSTALIPVGAASSSGGFGALLSYCRSRMINGGLILSS